ncbi:MAG: GAF domain-containing protein [Chloroflexi bacterium]|nr:GAF domain-containing protein [Chloroflexota bacterium]
MSQQHTFNLSSPALAEATTELLRELVTLSEASQEISAELSIDKLLQRIVDRARSLVGCQYAALSVIGEDRRIRSFITSGIDEGARERLGDPPVGKGILGLILDADQPLRLDDISQHPTSAGFPPNHPIMKTFLGISIRYAGKTFGNLYLTEKHGGGPFTEVDAQLVRMFAAQAGVALENARLFAEVQQQQRDAIQERLSMEAVLNSTAQGIYTLNADWRITRVNSHALRMTGKTADQVIGRPCWEVFPYQTTNGRSLCQSACPARLTIASHASGYIMEAVLPLNERPLPVALLTDAIHDQDGKVVGVVETVRDITQRKEVDEIRDNIVSLVSHELRTPLAHIKGFSSSLLQPDVEWDEETKIDFIRSIDHEADRLSRLVSDLLDMSRLESGRTVMRPEPVDAVGLVHSAIERTGNFLRDHVVEVDIPRDLPRLAVDPNQSERVLENLLENAAKYSPPNSQITVSARRLGAHLRLGVHDQGIGIPNADKERIFEKFVRLEQDKAFRSPGTGLGLSICKSIVEAHGGHIWVENNKGGKGSAFYFTLPLAMGRQRPPTSIRGEQ